MINVKKTASDVNKGYNPETLAPTSNQLVWWSCPKCGADKEYSYAYCLRKAEKAQKDGSPAVCQKCAHAHRKGKASVKKQPNSFVELPPEVDVALTQERYGHDPRTLAPWSREQVVLKCFKTGVTCTTRRCSLNRYKSIIETGHFYSVGAWTAERRRGTKASDATKQAMKDSQQKRRAKEKVQVDAPVQPVVAPQMPQPVSPWVKK